MNKPILFSDLDQTLIYSAGSIIQHGQQVAGNLCIEQLDDKPLSFTSLDAWLILKEHVGKTFDFVPVTTRNQKQYQRVNFPGIPIEYAIIDNGATILKNGNRDILWDNKIAAKLAQLEHSIESVHQRMVKGLEDHREVKILSNLLENPNFVYMVAHSKEDMEYIKSFAYELSAETGYTVSIQSRKAYLLPPVLTKVAAVNEIKERLSPTFTVAAGDTPLDYTMVAGVDIFVRPKHGEPLNDVDHYTTKHSGIEVPFEIMETVLQNA